MIPRKLKILILVLVIAMSMGYMVYRRLTNYQNLTLTVVPKDSALRVIVYREVGDQRTEVLETTQNQTLRLSKGSYRVETADNDVYAPFYEQVELENEPVVVVVNPEFSEKKLAEMLEDEARAIQTAIQTTFVGVINGYVVAPGKLYGDGTWFGTSLEIKQSDEERRLNYADKYRLIAHKESGRWLVVTKPPELILNSIAYPNIPKNILSDVNRL